MAETPSITRRAALRAFPAFGAALAVPSAAVAASDPWAEIKKQIEQVSALLEEIGAGQLGVRISPTSAEGEAFGFFHIRQYREKAVRFEGEAEMLDLLRSGSLSNRADWHHKQLRLIAEELF